MVAPKSSALIRFRYLMLSAHTALGSPPEGLSLTALRPYQGTPLPYALSSPIGNRTPWSTPVSYRRLPTSSHLIFIAVSSL